jgi:hypothetical protein
MEASQPKSDGQEDRRWLRTRHKLYGTLGQSPFFLPANHRITTQLFFPIFSLIIIFPAAKSNQ